MAQRYFTSREEGKLPLSNSIGLELIADETKSRVLKTYIVCDLLQ